MELDKCCKKLLIKSPFYGIFLLHLNKYYSEEVSTAGVKLNGINPELIVNKEFWNTLTEEEQLGVLTHEILHLVFKHPLVANKFDSHKKFNIAADLEVNSYIPVLQKDPYMYPKMLSLYNEEGTLYYYEQLPDVASFQQQLVDDHTWGTFKELDDVTRKLIENQIDSIAKDTVQSCKGIGSLPGKIQDYLNDLFVIKQAIFNWKAYFRRLIGNGITSDLTLTKMRPSKRFKDARGLRYVRRPNILVGVDTSGSINNSELLDFFSEIHHIWKTGVQVKVAQVDTCVQHLEDYNGTFNKQIYGRGGTEFLDLFNYYNKHKRDFSMLVIFTDGYVSLSLPQTQNLIWVITKNGNHQDYPGKTIYIPNDKS